MAKTRVRNTLVLLAVLWAGPVLAGARTVVVPPPGGHDDTQVLQSSLDRCVAFGPGCTVQLAAGRYLTRQLVSYGFRGTLRGRGQAETVLEALPDLPVHMMIRDDDNAFWPPDATDHTWPSLLLFVDGDIHVSDLAIRITAVPATQPYLLMPGWTVAALIDAIRFMGKQRTNATVEHVTIEGREDASDTSLFGFNVTNGISYLGELPTGSGVAFDYHRISGSLRVAATSVKSAGSGVYPGIVTDSRIRIGGSPSDGNSFENVAVGADLESIENSLVEVSHNSILGATWAGAWAVPWCCGYLPKQPTLFLIHDNTLTAKGDAAEGVVLADDAGTPWIRALVSANTIEAQDIGGSGISAYNASGTTVWNNRISGRGAAAIGLWGARHGTVLANDVEDFTGGSAQIVLDSGTSHSIVVCKTRGDTVLDQGQGNREIGCQAVPAP